MDVLDDVQDGDLFRSFFWGGFECSTHRRADGRRLDLLSATGHDRHADADYQLLAAAGIHTVREGVRWHRIEAIPGRFDWSSLLPLVQAARATDMQVVWDLCHYGWPDGLDIWSPEFVGRFARFAAATARFIGAESDTAPVFCPMNEISFLAWAGGDMGYMNPFGHGEGDRLKCLLVRAAIAAVDAVRTAIPRARFVYAEPAINVAAGAPVAEEQAAARSYHLSQFEAYDMLSGRLRPELGGAPGYLDIVGVNFYPYNQWHLGGATIPFGRHDYRPLHELLVEFHDRYGRPMVISETGAEGSARAAWLHYVAAEVRQAQALGVPVHGVCLYPVLDYPGWDNDRPCDVGLLTARDADGRCGLHRPLVEELLAQRARLPPARPKPRVYAATGVAKGIASHG
ncbi:beta-glucosidase [Nitrospirillum sp. BR 11828]|uniref:beta-glucosidase n=1 Tax=Nitrospirillum sp. BR 11828 TaxID=3104325 RepID=UPI002ACA9025|nr:beta-glucosidase [Nitrospirillum sp. BR 11828]MDZ5645778.1 beta-glucosidase [Nitrospirillum sp. BR 11828]